jgi:hypothetical protein
MSWAGSGVLRGSRGTVRPGQAQPEVRQRVADDPATHERVVEHVARAARCLHQAAVLEQRLRRVRDRSIVKVCRKTANKLSWNRLHENTARVKGRRPSGSFRAAGGTGARGAVEGAATRRPPLECRQPGYDQPQSRSSPSFAHIVSTTRHGFRGRLHSLRLVMNIGRELGADGLEPACTPTFRPPPTSAPPPTLGARAPAAPRPPVWRGNEALKSTQMASFGGRFHAFAFHTMRWCPCTCAYAFLFSGWGTDSCAPSSLSAAGGKHHSFAGLGRLIGTPPWRTPRPYDAYPSRRARRSPRRWPRPGPAG